MPDPVGRLILHEREAHLEARRPLVVGDTLEMIRGNGSRERRGTSTPRSVVGGTAEPVDRLMAQRIRDERAATILYAARETRRPTRRKLTAVGSSARERGAI